MSTNNTVQDKPEPDVLNEIHPLIRRRWSPRGFSDKPITEDIAMSLFEAARWAPSSYNEQPWRFIYAMKNDEEAFQKLCSCLVPGNVEWAKNAPMLVLAVAKKTYSHNGKHYRHSMHDLGLALGNFTVEATSRDLYLRQMGGFVVDKSREVFEIPNDYEPATMVAVGYLGSVESLTDNFVKTEYKQQVRKPIEELVFNGFFQR
ncbi:MAG: nitroreductase family protein [Okeania sp. SIO3C4]|nr:nitroreductase family protein [Okeania sp. SIO3C4]